KAVSYVSFNPTRDPDGVFSHVSEFEITLFQQNLGRESRQDACLINNKFFHSGVYFLRVVMCATKRFFNDSVDKSTLKKVFCIKLEGRRCFNFFGGVFP